MRRLPHADWLSVDGSVPCAVAHGAVSCTGTNYTFQRGEKPAQARRA